MLETQSGNFEPPGPFASLTRRCMRSELAGAVHVGMGADDLLDQGGARNRGMPTMKMGRSLCAPSPSRFEPLEQSRVEGVGDGLKSGFERARIIGDRLAVHGVGLGIGLEGAVMVAAILQRLAEGVEDANLFQRAAIRPFDWPGLGQIEQAFRLRLA